MRPSLLIIPIALIAGASFLGGRALTDIGDSPSDLVSSTNPLATITTGTTTDDDRGTTTIEDRGTTTSGRDRDRGGRDDVIAGTVPAVNPDGHGGRGRDHAEDDGTVEHRGTVTTPTTTTTGTTTIGTTTNGTTTVEDGDDHGGNSGPGNGGGEDNSGPGSSNSGSGSANSGSGSSGHGDDDSGSDDD